VTPAASLPWRLADVTDDERTPTAVARSSSPRYGEASPPRRNSSVSTSRPAVRLSSLGRGSLSPSRRAKRFDSVGRTSQGLDVSASLANLMDLQELLAPVPDDVMLASPESGGGGGGGKRDRRARRLQSAGSDAGQRHGADRRRSNSVEESRPRMMSLNSTASRRGPPRIAPAPSSHDDAPPQVPESQFHTAMRESIARALAAGDGDGGSDGGHSLGLGDMSDSRQRPPRANKQGSFASSVHFERSSAGVHQVRCDAAPNSRWSRSLPGAPAVVSTRRRAHMRCVRRRP
jgi:hypothetical protein